MNMVILGYLYNSLENHCDYQSEIENVESISQIWVFGHEEASRYDADYGFDYEEIGYGAG